MIRISSIISESALLYNNPDQQHNDPDKQNNDQDQQHNDLDHQQNDPDQQQNDPDQQRNDQYLFEHGRLSVLNSHISLNTEHI